MAYNTFRKKDMNVEREVANYLDKHLYTKNIFTRAERTDSPESQMKGSDIIISIPNLNIENVVVDEKAAIYYANKNLPTFALELSFLNSGLHYSEGWFVNSTLATEYYLMQWLKTETDKPWEIRENNIKEIECVLVSKKKLHDYFENQGYTYEKFKEIDSYIRTTELCPQTNTKEFRFYYSNKLAEKPINIVLRKEVYIRLGEFHLFC